MKVFRHLTAILLIILCSGCAGVTNESSAPSYEDSVSLACRDVQLGADQEGLDTTTRDFHWLKAATQFRNLSNQNQIFADYAEGLNAWATGSASGKIYQVFDFCGTTY
jgi:hypothetical protein